MSEEKQQSIPPTAETVNKNIVIDLARQYVAATKCTCSDDTICWHCSFEYNLRHLDAGVVQ